MDVGWWGRVLVGSHDPADQRHRGFMLLAQSLMGHVPLRIQFLVFLQFFLSTATHLLSTGSVMNLPLGITLVLASVYMAQTLCPLCVSYRLVYLLWLKGYAL